MPPPRTTLHLKASLAVAALGGALVVGLPLLSPLAGSSPGQRTIDTEFRPVNRDGALPKRPARLGPPDAPLEVDERGYAIRLAQRSMPAGSEDVLGKIGGEVLGADLPPLGEREPGRRVLVSLYDYDSDLLHQVLVDLASDSVVDSETVSGAQLPPSVAETSVATQLALESDPAPAFIEEYGQVTGAPLLAADQLHAVAGVWRGTAAEPTGPTSSCGEKRCLQLLLALPSGQYLNTHDFVVDLSSRSLLPVSAMALGHEGHGHEH